MVLRQLYTPFTDVVMCVLPHSFYRIHGFLAAEARPAEKGVARHARPMEASGAMQKYTLLTLVHLLEHQLK